MKKLKEKLENMLKIPYLKEPLYQIFSSRAQELLDDLNNKEFRVSIVGEFSAGKSTFLNALIGKDILPHAVNETTATVTYIKNVNSSHPLCNKMEVEFFGDEPNLITELPTDPTGLVQYVTTMSKDRQVVSEISSVTIYVDFPYTEEPIVFIDTPGLNGVAEGHYERTRYEIQRAHTSIYLLHTRGLTQSNVEMYDLLRQYQSSFLFVINAIDSLKADEGETAETKLAELREQLTEIGVAENTELYGVSALLALAAKDTRIEKLYDSDTEPLTDERRAELLQKSRFPQVEEAIWKRLVSSDKEAVRMNNIQQKVEELAKDIIIEFEEQVALFEIVVEEQRLQEIDMRIQNAKLSKEVNLKNVDSFISARSIDMRSMLYKKIDEDVQQLNEQLNNELNNTLKKEVAQKNQVDPSKVIENLQEQIKKELKTREKHITESYIPTLSNLLQDLHESALVRLEKYYPKVTITQMKRGFDVQLEKAQLEDLSLKKKLQEKKETVKTVEQQSRTALQQYNENYQLVSTLQSEVTTSMNNMDYVKRNEKAQIARLGSRPNIEKKRVTYSVEVERRGGFIGRLWGKVAGPKYETRTREETDSTERDRWDQQVKSTKAKFEAERRTLERKAEVIRNRLYDQQIALDETSSRKSRLEKQQQDLERDIRLLDTEFKEIYEKNKLLYFNKQQKEIAATLEHYILTDLKQYYRKIVEKTIEKETNIIAKMIQKEHESSYKQYVNKLENFKQKLQQQAVPEERKEAEKRLKAVKKAIA